MKMRFFALFTLCVFTPLVATAQPSQMQSPQDIARHIIELTKSGEQMNLKAVGSALGEPDLYNTAVFTSVGENSSYGNTYRPPKTLKRRLRLFAMKFGLIWIPDFPRSIVLWNLNLRTVNARVLLILNV